MTVWMESMKPFWRRYWELRDEGRLEEAKALENLVKQSADEARKVWKQMRKGAA